VLGVDLTAKPARMLIEQTWALEPLSVRNCT
jgi:hypothetical protein